MKILKKNEIEAFIAKLKKRASVSVREDDIQRTVRKIIIDVQKQGDNAVRRYTEKFDAIKVLHRKYRKPVTVFAGVIIGILVTLSSVGAGVIGAAFLFFLYPRLKAIQIVGTDLAHAIPITAIAGLGHAHIGTVDYILLGSLLIGSLPGIYLGSHFGTFLPDKIMRPVLASMLLIIGIRLAF